MYILILVFVLIRINIDMCISLLLSLEFICCSRFCCFAAPIAMPNNDNTLIYVNHAQLEHQIKNGKIVKI